MPYINMRRREQLNNKVNDLYISDVGSLNYCITKIINNYCKINGLSYRTINDVLGLLEAIKQEFYRRVGSKLEDKKIIENGDIDWVE